MKTLVEYIAESTSGDQFKETLNISMKEFEDWKKKNEKNYDIVYSEADKLYAIYSVKDKSNPVWKGEHVATYDCTSGKFFCDDKKIIK